jgi:alpha-D-ribose 1-methylphosphonate 5-triphosphate synthase subunit PhnH
MSRNENAVVSPGFAHPALDSQAMFRALLRAMAEPGRAVPCPVRIDGAPLPPVLAAVALTLLDYETPAFLAGAIASQAVRGFLGFHTGAPLQADAVKAAFVLALSQSALPPVALLGAGTPEYPDRSATVILGVTDFEEGTSVSLSGPGILGSREFRAGGLHAEFWDAAAANAARFPLGVDFILCGPEAVAGLPRSAVPEILAR